MYQRGVLGTSACAGVAVVCTLQNIFDISVYACEHTLHRLCTYFRIFAFLLWTSRSWFGGFEPVYAGHFLLAVGVNFDRGKVRGVVFCFVFFDRESEYVCVCVCVYAHTHTHTAYRVLGLSPCVETGHLENPGKIQMYCSASIHINWTCVRSKCAYVYAGLQVDWTSCFFWFFLTCLFFSKKKRKGCEQHTCSMHKTTLLVAPCKTKLIMKYSSQ